MRLLWAAAAAGLLFCGATQAEEQTNQQPNNPTENQLTVGVGLICNTPEQVQRYVSLRATGKETALAVSAVNEEAQDPRACGVAVVAFMRDETVNTATMEGKLVSITRINILAAFDGTQWARVAGMVQYALLEPDGYAI